MQQQMILPERKNIESYSDDGSWPAKTLYVAYLVSFVAKALLHCIDRSDAKLLFHVKR